MVNSKPKPGYSQVTKAMEFNSQFLLTRKCFAGQRGYSISVKRANMAFRTASLYESAVETP